MRYYGLCGSYVDAVQITADSPDKGWGDEFYNKFKENYIRKDEYVRDIKSGQVVGRVGDWLMLSSKRRLPFITAESNFITSEEDLLSAQKDEAARRKVLELKEREVTDLEAGIVVMAASLILTICAILLIYWLKS